MYAARLITVILLILVILFAYSPQVRETVTGSWEMVRPGAVALMDNVYAVVRSVLTGNGPHDRLQTPSPSSPDVNFQRIVTMSSIVPG
jgi:hypothetical protein